MGNGQAKREFLFSEDLAEAVILILRLPNRYKKFYLIISIILMLDRSEYTKEFSKNISNIVGFKVR